MGTPALMGGYEYTVDQINLRKDEKLVDKHNEALKMMPVLFDQNDFDVTVFDPIYANYQWVPSPITRTFTAISPSAPLNRT